MSEFEHFLTSNIFSRIYNLNSNCDFLKIYKLDSNINMNKFLKILNLNPFYKYKKITTITSGNILHLLTTNQLHCVDEIKECPICYDKIEENVYLRKLKCNHEFHKKCIDKWLFTQFRQYKEEFTCPICRKNVYV